jgi:hypothetical protein
MIPKPSSMGIAGVKPRQLVICFTVEMLAFLS